MVRRRIYSIIERADEGDTISRIYDIFMLIVIIISIIPIAFKEINQFLLIIDYSCAGVFILDYLLRWITADLKLKNRYAFIVYVVTPFAVIDLLAILPTFSVVNGAFRILKIFRGFKAFRIFKTLRYSKNFIMIGNVIKKNVSILLSILVCSAFYILVSALFIFSVEPESFHNFFEAIYWATTALTTVGYGDIYPITAAGRLISMVSSFFGIGLVALPAGVITAGFMSEMNQNYKTNESDAN